MEPCLITYVREETRGFGERALTDVDLLALSAAMYLEFERFDQLSEVGASVPFNELERFGDLRLYAENDYHPRDTEALLRALAASPRFAQVPIERFECVVQDEPALQFAAACFPISTDAVVVAFRGTNMQLQGWQEDFEMMWRDIAPGQVRALRYLHEAAAAYPQAKLYV